MYETLLALHLLSAAVMVAAIVYFTALRMHVPLVPAHYKLAQALVAVGATLVLVFGVWLALYLDAYEIWDPWILISIVLWVVSSVAGSKSGGDVDTHLAAGGADTATIRGGEVLHWISVAAAVGILVLMIFKPGA